MRQFETFWLRSLLGGSLLGAAALSLAQGTPGTAPVDSGAAKPQATKPAKGKAAKPPAAAAKADDAKDAKEPAGDDKKPAGDQAAAKADDAKDAKEPKEKQEFLLVEPGYQDWRLRGSENKFRQYATPPRGVYLNDFRLRPLFTPQAEDFSLNIKSIGLPDYVGEGQLGLFYGATRASLLLSRNEFFNPTPSLIPISDRRVDRASIRQQLWKDFSFSFGYRNDDADKFYQEPTQPLSTTSRYRDFIFGGRVGNGYATLKLLQWNNVIHPGGDRKDVLEDYNTQALHMAYLWNITPHSALEGAYTRTWIDQSNANSARLDVLSLDGDIALGSSTDLDLFLRQQHVQIPAIQNAYVRDQRSGALSISHRFSNWTVQGGLKVQEAERLRADHSFVDVPRWRTVDAKVRGRLARTLRVAVRASSQTMDHAPVMLTDDTRSLYWSGRDTAQVNFDWAPRPEFTGYLNWSYKHWRNTARNTSLTDHTVSFGGNWQVSPNLDLFGEFTRDIWGGHGENLIYPTLDNFVPDSQVSAIGLNWSFGPRAFVSVSYSDFTSYNDNPLLIREGNTHGSFLTVNGRYLFPRGYELGLIVAPWTFRDKVVSTQDYNATVVMVTGSARF